MKDTTHPSHIIISLGIFWTKIIIYLLSYTSSGVLVHLFRNSCAYEKYRETDRQGDSYISPILCLQGVKIESEISICNSLLAETISKSNNNTHSEIIYFPGRKISFLFLQKKTYLFKLCGVYS